MKLKSTTTTIVDHFRKHLNTDKVACEVETGKTLSFREMMENADRRKADFYDYDRKIVMVILPNSIFYLEYFLAVLSSNNIFNPIPYFIGLQELKTVLKYVEPACIVTDREDIINDIKEEYRIINPLTDLLPEKSFADMDKEIDPDAPAALYYSSGTTGDPKGVLYSHKNMVSLIGSIIRLMQIGSREASEFPLMLTNAALATTERYCSKVITFLWAITKTTSFISRSSKTDGFTPEISAPSATANFIS